jgi:hypothetical protein
MAWEAAVKAVTPKSNRREVMGCPYWNCPTFIALMKRFSKSVEKNARQPEDRAHYSLYSSACE